MEIAPAQLQVLNLAPVASKVHEQLHDFRVTRHEATRRHPTSDDPRTVAPPDPDAIVTVSLDSLALIAVYMYLGAVVSRLEMFTSTSLRAEVRCSRAKWIEILAVLKSDDALHLRSFFAQVGELDRLVAIAKKQSVYQRPQEEQS